MTAYDLLLEDARVVTPAGTIPNGWVGVRNCVIAGLGAGPCPDDGFETRHLGGAWLGPGFIDIPTHGSVGISVMDTDADGLRALSRFFATRG